MGAPKDPLMPIIGVLEEPYVASGGGEISEKVRPEKKAPIRDFGSMCVRYNADNSLALYI